ncbi:MAG: hypothetical protein KJO98_16880 [Rhodothermia bacterium]|nr:hypothetical protein [Rhodothermia bacterium]
MTKSDPLAVRLAVPGIVILLLVVTACDSSIRPPESTEPGFIIADITYVSDWPPANQFVDLRFVAMRFVPQDTTDFLQLNRLEFSEGLQYGVTSQTVVLEDVVLGTYPFAVVARQRTSDILSWEAMGIYEEGEGIFRVNSAETSRVAITVDFDNLPDFP